MHRDQRHGDHGREPTRRERLGRGSNVLFGAVGFSLVGLLLSVAAILGRSVATAGLAVAALVTAALSAALWWFVLSD